MAPASYDECQIDSLDQTWAVMCGGANPERTREAVAMTEQRLVNRKDLLNPIRMAMTPETVALYRVEPYVLAGDVYGQTIHIGRGGWTWYTGSASWLYRIGVDTLLGFRKRGDRLHIDPRIPATWKEYRITYRHGSSTYQILVVNPHGVESGVARVEMDGAEVVGGEIVLSDDGKKHEVRVEMGT